MTVLSKISSSFLGRFCGCRRTTHSTARSDCEQATTLNHDQHTKKHRFRLPATTKIIMSVLVLIVGSTIWTMSKELKLWDPRTLYQDMSIPVYDKNTTVPTNMPFQRVVFLDGKPWKRSNRTQTRYTVYPIRPSRNTTDITRLYPTSDSADMPFVERRRWPQHEFDPHCVPIADWQHTFHPVCNELHAADLKFDVVQERLSLLSAKGYWRHAWTRQDEINATTVWKTFKLDHNMEEAFFENNRVDSIAMDKLTASPYVINIYGMCGLSVVTELAGKDVAVVAGQLNSTERLELAIKAAQGVADIHSIDSRPTLAHNDMNLANLVITLDHRPVWNDFNCAVLLMKHNETNETCPFISHYPNPQWKAPEEQENDEEGDPHPLIVTEKIDIYALGNVFYRLTVLRSPWKRPGALRLEPDEKLQVARLKRINGTLPDVPQSVQESKDPAVQAMVKAMYMCYRFKPKERPTATAVAAFLEHAMRKIRQNQTTTV